MTLTLEHLLGIKYPVVVRPSGAVEMLENPDDILRTVEPKAEDASVMERIELTQGLVMYHSKFAESFDPLNTTITLLTGTSVYGTVVFFSE